MWDGGTFREEHHLPSPLAYKKPVSSNLPPPRSDVEKTDVHLHFDLNATLRRLRLDKLVRNRTRRESFEHLILCCTVERNNDVRKLISWEFDHNTLDIVDVVEPFGDGNLDAAPVRNCEILVCYFVSSS